MNAVVKGPPWRPSTDGFNVDSSLVDEDFALLQKVRHTPRGPAPVPLRNI